MIDIAADNYLGVKENFDSFVETTRTVAGESWANMCTALAENAAYDGIVYLGMREAPAAKANHHNYVGGLIQHYQEMWQIHLGMDSQTLFNDDPLITDSRVLRGIILHDLHKAWCHFVHDSSVQPSGLNYGDHPSSKLLTADQKTSYIASKYVLDDLDLIQLNAMYHSEGGWASSPPKWSSVLAKYLYLLDELSSNVKSRTTNSGMSISAVTVFGDKGVSKSISPDWLDL